MSNQEFEVYAPSERCITISFGKIISTRISAIISKFDKAIHATPFAGYITTVPAYVTLTIYYDPVMVNKSTLSGHSCFEKIHQYLLELNLNKIMSSTSIRQIDVPVLYDTEHGPDLDLVARKAKISIEEVINIHSKVSYTVHMIGFVPGFAYLGGMDKILSTPRKSTPRSNIAAGSVGIAGEQTGIYSLQTPGGWQIIGRTPLKLFDAKLASPSLLQAGDTVIFKPITLAEFQVLTQMNED